MHATTIKIEDPLLKEVMSLLPEKTSLSAFVRRVLEREVQKRKMLESAEAYSQFLKSNPKEKEWLDAWETAPLERPTR